MIIPFPKNILKFINAPLTWVFLLLNLVIFFAYSDKPNRIYENKMFKSSELALAGRLYSQYLNDPKVKVKNKALLEYKNKKMDMNFEKLITLGGLSLRDPLFANYVQTHSLKGDQVHIQHWKENFLKFKNYQKQNNFRIFGLSSQHQSPLAWITYQFMHSGVVHLLFNMVFLILIGTAVEGLVGGMGLITTYIVGGIMGGVFYLYLSSTDAIPVIGASASLSALLAFYLTIEPKQRIRYIYFISPSDQHYGLVYLPKLLIFPMFILSDITQVLISGGSLTSSIAHSAHVGGAIAGFVLGYLEVHFFKHRLNHKPS